MMAPESPFLGKKRLISGIGRKGRCYYSPVLSYVQEKE